MKRRNILSLLTVGALGVPFAGGYAMAGPTQAFRRVALGTPLPDSPHKAVEPEVMRRATAIERVFYEVGQYMVNQRGHNPNHVFGLYADTIKTTAWIRHNESDVFKTEEHHLFEGRLSQATAAMRATGKAHVYSHANSYSGGREAGLMLEYGASVRPDGSTLVVVRERPGAGKPFALIHAAEIDAQGKVKPIEKPDLKEFGVNNPARDLMHREPKPAFTPASGFRPSGAKPG
jgi:hypothetical protein